MWFHLFNTIDRVRLWNRLMFSDRNFKRIAMKTTHIRPDLKNFFDEKIGDLITEAETELKNEKRKEYTRKLSLDEESRSKTDMSVGDS